MSILEINETTVVQEKPPFMHTVNPSCTGTSGIALAYKDGVAIATDTTISYGSHVKYLHAQRQYVVNKYCIVAYSGDCADFQWLQNYIECEQEKFRYRIGDQMSNLTPKMLHSLLTSYFYYRRTKFDPLWNTLIVAGLKPVELQTNEYKPFIGVVQKHGTAYETAFVATGLASFTLNQVLETEAGPKVDEISRDKALKILCKAMEISMLSDRSSKPEFHVSYIDDECSSFLKLEKRIGNWDISEKDCQYS